ncbi:unnamed protein product, partial [Rotaria socialis]
MSNSKNNSPNIRRKLALVIGNQNYVKRPLRHSENDANDLHAVLTDIGFTVDRELNLLVKMTAPGGSIIQFACAPGYRAADGYDQERNGLYTKYLLKHIARPKVEINLIFRRITRDVFEESKAKQKPYIKGDLMTEEPIYLSAGDSND